MHSIYWIMHNGIFSKFIKNCTTEPWIVLLVAHLHLCTPTMEYFKDTFKTLTNDKALVEYFAEKHSEQTKFKFGKSLLKVNILEYWKYFAQKHLQTKVKVGKSRWKANARDNFLIPLCVPVGHCHFCQVLPYCNIAEVAILPYCQGYVLTKVAFCGM